VAPTAVYVHIPFCAHKCHYCDFTAYVVDGQPVDLYLEALEQEMALTVEQVPPAEIEAIFIGGGTPTVLTPPQMERLLRSIRTHFPNRSPQLEFTIEANPETTHAALLQVMKEGGVNRISFGAQTFHPDLLAQIGRLHGVKEIERSVRQAREVGFQNVSLDLMFGLPQQTVADMRETLDRAVALQPEHFSCYQLKVEEGTRFHHLYLRNQLPLPSEEDELEMYQLLRKYLAQHDYVQYEVSNFAKAGYESRHNSVYWLNQAYYGLGAGAHGYMNQVRHANLKGVKAYIHQIGQGRRPVSEEHVVNRSEEMENFMILGLRLLRGVSCARFASLYHVPIDSVFASVLPHLVQQGLIQFQGDRTCLTEKGLLFGNDVFASFIGNVEIEPNQTRVGPVGSILE
jgi:putative oxygen-independent coproporphyrinogen III oxidase